MSIKKIYIYVAVGATVILVVSMMVVLSTLYFAPIPNGPDGISPPVTDKSSNLHFISFDQENNDQTDNSSVDLSNNSPCISSLYISLDPVKDLKAGDQIVVSGETNTEMGSIITLKVTPVFTGKTEDSNSKTTFKSFLGLMGTTRVLEENGPIHHWTWIANSTELAPNIYEVTASIKDSFSNQEQIPGIEFSGVTRFTLT